MSLKGNKMSTMIRKGIRSVFVGTDQEKVLYRLSTNIYNIRKDGGIVKVIKDGRKVKAYQLVNFDQFDKNGRFIHQKAQTQKKSAKVETVASVQTEDMKEAA